MSSKHKLKLLVREAFARVLFHTGLHRVVDACMGPRLTILAGHCVSSGAPAGHLPADMQISAANLERILSWFKARYELVTVGDGFRRLHDGRSKSRLVALSMDDGYRDNHRTMLPILTRLGAPATVFLESRPLDERRVNWSHKYFWILERMTHFDFVHRFGALSKDARTFHAANQIVTEGREDPRYHVKRLFKYDADTVERDRVIDVIFREQGGDERALCDELYMSWDEARELAAGGVELGGHTVNHVILSKCPPREQRHEIEEGKRAVERGLGATVPTFAYPWGRRWDFDAESKEAARQSGFACAVTMHAGTNRADTEPFELKRLAIDDDARLHLLAAEACGGFELLRRLGVNLSE